MLNIVKAEIYKFIHRPFIYVLTGIIAAGIALVFLILNIGEPADRMYIITRVSPMGIEMILYAVFLYTVNLYEEYKYGSIKNIITSNISREKIFFGKFIAQGIVALVSSLVIFFVFIMGMCLLKGGDGYSPAVFRDFIIRLLSLVPVLFGALAMANFLGVLIQKENIVTFIYIFIILASQKVVQFLSIAIWSKIGELRSWLLRPQLSIIENLSATRNDISHVIVVGVVTTIIFTILGCIVFKNKEVK